MEKVSHVRCGWLIDGSGGPVQEKIVLSIVGDRIAEIQKDTGHLTSHGAECVDLSHCTIVPPLVDGHLHLFMSATTDVKVRDAQLKASCEELFPSIKRHVDDLFSHGVLGFRDGGDRGGCALGFCTGEEMHPEVIAQCAGRGWYREGRYGSLVGRPVTASTELARAFAEGEGDCDVVKVVNSGLNSLHEFGKETKPQFSEKELRALVLTARANGKKVMVHANGMEPVRRAVAAGCHSIEHGFFMGEENLQLMAEMGTFWVPTIFTMKAYGMNIGTTRWKADLRIIEKIVEHQIGQLRRARELGVKVAMGTDAGSIGVLHGESMVEEMKLFKRAGYPFVETIQCATVRGAELLGIDQFKGISNGGTATFLVCRGAPSQLPRKLLYLESIWVGGEPSRLYRKNPVKHVS
jgi:imidazolonepropionase-like amidohydrolase